ncbi:hypothetical protein HYX17_03950 [Candidatus Woesearchaeota archaeon]|nr:hypothetical protein [Candidatus Woesearchaeota archaeon]
MTNVKEVPYFIQVRGCINCDASKQHKKKHGTDYGFDHELQVSCVLRECHNYGYDLQRPFIDPEEVVNYAKRTGNQEFIKRAKEYCLGMQTRFGISFAQIGVSLEKIMGEI